MYFIGDTHGMRPVFQIIDRLKLENQNLIHVGDFGLGFVSIDQDLNNLEAMDEALLDTNNHLYVIRGNHDNPLFWDKSKGLNLLKYHNIHLIDDYTVKNIEGKNILFVGGAISIDRRPRMIDLPYPTWWKDEVFKYDDVRLVEATKNHDNIDIVVTHTAPGFCYPIGSDGVDIVEYYHKIEAQHGLDLKEELANERRSMTEMHVDLTLNLNIKPTHWFYGHFHASKKQKIGDTEFKLLNINEVYELN